MQRTEEIDGQVLRELGGVAQIVVKGDAGIVDEHIEAIDLGGGLLDLRSLGHIEPDRRHAWLGGERRTTASGIDALRAAPQRFGEQRLAETAVGAGDQYDLVRDVHVRSPEGWKCLR